MPDTAYADSFARPDGSPSTRWVNGIGALPCSDLLTHLCVDEVVRDDSDYIQTTALGNGGSDSQFFTMSNIADPLQSTGHILRYTLREGNQGTNPVGFTIILRQGSTVIATFAHAQGTLPTTFTLFQQTLTNAQADSITNYNNLELTLIGSCTTGCANSPSARERVAVSWVEFAIITTIPPPTLNGVVALDSTSLQLFWTQPLDLSKVLSYNIERSSGGGSFSVVANVPVGTIQYIDGGLQPNTAYTYRLVSVGTTGNSIPSNQITQTTTVFNIPSDYARPDSSTGLRWVDGIGTNCTALNNYLCIDEKIRDDADYIQTIGLGNGGTDTELLTLSNIKDPILPYTHVLRYTVAKANVGTNPVALQIQLRQGPAVIATFTHPQGTLPSIFTEFNQILTTAQADSITDYNSLELTLTASCAVGCGNNPADREKIKVSWIEFEVLFPIVNQNVAEKIGRSALITWEVPQVSSNIEKYVVQRSLNGGSFSDLFELTNQTNKIINTETGRQFYSGIDSTVAKGSSYTYKIFEVKNSKRTIEPSQTQQVTIPANLGYFTNKAVGSVMIPATPLVPFPKPPNPIIYFLDESFFGQQAFADTIPPLIISTVNPKNEPYQFALEPLPSPSGSSNCNQLLEIRYMRDQSSGQDLSIYASLFENNIVKNQELLTNISDSNSRIFQTWMVILPAQQVITDYTNLKVQLDIDSSTDPNPSNWRKLSIYEVNFYLPEGNLGC